MSKQLLVVFGATGNQGGSVVRAVLTDPELSARYTVRAITRDTSSPKAQALRSLGADVVSADLDNPSSLPAALKAVNFVFAPTNTSYDGNTRTIETRQATALVDEAIAQGATYIIWSSLPSPSKISKGKLQHAQHFDVKAEIEAYIRAKPVKSAFFSPASFMQNYEGVLRPQPAGDGSYVLANIMPADSLLPLIDVTETGAWVGAILASPEKYEGKTFSAADRLYSYSEIVEILSRVSGKVVKHERVPDEVFKGYLPEVTRDMMFDMYALFRDYGYYGEKMEEEVKWAREQARGKVSGLEEYLRRTGWALD